MEVLIIDDELPVCEALSALLRQEGLTCAWETDPTKAVSRARDASVVLLDLKLPGVTGLELLEKTIEELPRTPVIMLTAHGTVRTAVEAMKKGAFDFILKPPDQKELIGVIRKALRTAEVEIDTSELCFDLPEELVFADRRSQEVLESIRNAAPTEMVVLLEGETGVGKEIFARLLHEWSPRSKRPFIKINCAAIPENLFESEIFGYEKGAFTGANISKPGRAELAEGGTLFLDEVGELGLTSQAKLLQFLQDRTFERVGGLRTLEVNLRLAAATNRDLEACTRDGTFRSDLFYRLSGFRILVPPLRERKDDIEALARDFLDRFSSSLEKTLRFGPGVTDALCQHDWPGNVRELENTIERAVAVARGPAISITDLFPEPSKRGPEGSLKEQRKAFERERIRKALAVTGGNRTEAAKLLGISRRMLQKKLKDFDIQEG